MSSGPPNDTYITLGSVLTLLHEPGGGNSMQVGPPPDVVLPDMGMSKLAGFLHFPLDGRYLRNWLLLMRDTSSDPPVMKDTSSDPPVMKDTSSDSPGVIRNNRIECVLIQAPIEVRLESNLKHWLDSLGIAFREKRPVMMQLKNGCLTNRTFDLAGIELVQKRD